jgi:hypothetical protein
LIGLGGCIHPVQNVLKYTDIGRHLFNFQLQIRPDIGKANRIFVTGSNAGAQNDDRIKQQAQRSLHGFLPSAHKTRPDRITVAISALLYFRTGGGLMLVIIADTKRYGF